MTANLSDAALIAEAERERDEARARVAELESALRGAHSRADERQAQATELLGKLEASRARVEELESTMRATAEALRTRARGTQRGLQWAHDAAGMLAQAWAAAEADALERAAQECEDVMGRNGIGTPSRSRH